MSLIANGKDTALNRFHEICGDGFIGELTMGGELQAVIQIHTTSKAEQQSVSASVSASFSIVSGSASFSEAVKMLSKSHELRIWTFRRGGTGAIAITPDELSLSASTMPDNVKAAPSPTNAAIFSYITVLDDPSLPVSDFVGRERFIGKLASVAQAARDQLADAKYIIDNPSQFFTDPNDAPLLATEIAALEDFILRLREVALLCIQGGGSCEAFDSKIPDATARPARK